MRSNARLETKVGKISKKENFLNDLQECHSPLDEKETRAQRQLIKFTNYERLNQLVLYSPIYGIYYKSQEKPWFSLQFVEYEKGKNWPGGKQKKQIPTEKSFF